MSTQSSNTQSFLSKVMSQRSKNFYVSMLLVAISPFLANCVDSDNQILLKLPISLECESVSPLSPADSDFETTATLGGLYFNIDQVLSNGQIIGRTVDEQKQPKVHRAAPGFFSVPAQIRNGLAQTAEYTKIGIGSEYRIEQNGFNMEKVVLKAKSDDGLEFTFEDKPLGGFINVNTVLTAPTILLFNSTDLVNMRNVLQQNNLSDNFVSFQLEVQVIGNLSSGQKIKTSVARTPVTVCTGNCTGISTPICAVGKDK